AIPSRVRGMRSVQTMVDASVVSGWRSPCQTWPIESGFAPTARLSRNESRRAPRRTPQTGPRRAFVVSAAPGLIEVVLIAARSLRTEDVGERGRQLLGRPR